MGLVFLNSSRLINSGISALKANSNFSDWQKLKYNTDNSIVTSDPCN